MCSDHALRECLDVVPFFTPTTGVATLNVTHTTLSFDPVLIVDLQRRNEKNMEKMETAVQILLESLLTRHEGARVSRYSMG